VHTVEDLAGRAATDLMLVDGMHDPIPVFLAERLLPAPTPAALAVPHRDRVSAARAVP
jgi:hypothetical protein